ncbi:hypothetical protein [Vibrio phage CKB-S2]|nr:hypothetical protein [Vibrio phage CKB-S2]
MIMTRSRHRPINELTILDLVEEGEPHTFICYSDGDQVHWYSRFLQDGFKHCFVIHWDGQMWFRIEKLFGCFEVAPLVIIDGLAVGRLNIERYYRYLGFTIQVVDLHRREPERMRVKQLFSPNTCVEFIKDFLGISAYFVNTPYQLYRYLERN